jgi:DNA-binding CsgD family transcriptional regulator
MVTLNMTKGLVPLPEHRQRPVVVRDAEGRWSKPPGVGWSALGTRTVRGITLHRLRQTLWAADRDLRDPATAMLMDWGVDHQTGEALLWNEPTGSVTPWASGPVSEPYGDGAAFLAKVGAGGRVGPEVVDRDRVALAIGGFFVQPGESTAVESPWSEAGQQAVAQICAHYAHDYGIAWHDFPLAPADGFSFLAWHHEFGRGGGTVCPGRLVMDLTGELVERTRRILRAYQLGGDSPSVAPGIAYPEGMSPQLAAELFGELETDEGVVRFDERDPVARLWLEVGAVHGHDRYPTVIEVLPGRSPGERYLRFAGGLLIRQEQRLAEVVSTATRAGDGRATTGLGDRAGPIVSAIFVRTTPYGDAPTRSLARRDSASRFPLTARETEVLALLAEGLQDREIGSRFGISTRTVECHVTNLLRKLDVPNRVAAAALAVRSGVAANGPPTRAVNWSSGAHR